MIIKVGDRYADFTGELEIEKQSKLLNDISSTSGDFSYSAEMPTTANNISIFKIQSINILNKYIFTPVVAEIQNDDGIALYYGFIRIERVTSLVISFSFFSGNSNWIASITSDLSDLDLSEYDVDNTIANVVSSWPNDSGIVFPLIDRGQMTDRLFRTFVKDESFARFETDDFQPFIYLKNVFEKIFLESNLKITGELLEDVTYNSLIITSDNSSTQESINERTAFVGKITNQTISSGVFTKIEFADNTDPYYDGEKNLYDTVNFRYVADIPMLLKTEFKIDMDVVQEYDLAIRKNGVTIRTFPNFTVGGNLSVYPYTELDAGDYVEVFIRPNTSSSDAESGSTVKFTPIIFTRYFASELLPRITSSEFINNIFRMLNVVTDYDPFTKTVTLNLFKNIKDKEVIDISGYIVDEEADYIDFVSDYGKINNLNYGQPDYDEPLIDAYDKGNKVRFGAGVIEIDNFYIDNENDLIDIDFIPAMHYINDATGISLLKMNGITQNPYPGSVDILSVTDNAGIARFNITSLADLFNITPGASVLLITDASLKYQGTGKIANVGFDYFELVGVTYKGNSTGSIQVMRYEKVFNGNTYIAINRPNVPVSDISQWSDIYLNEDPYTDVAYAYFSRNNQPELPINNNIYGLNFGPINDPSFYQVGLIDQYYSEIVSIMNDPVTHKPVVLLPEVVFRQMTNLRPIYFNIGNNSGRFYQNKISGYKNSYTPCTFELIKL